MGDGRMAEVDAVSLKPLLVACRILEDEVTYLLKRDHLEDAYDILYLDDQLHNHPEKLRARVQEIVDGTTDRPMIMFTFGHCGRGLEGVTARDIPLVMLRYADCISAVLNNLENLDRVRTSTYFLTRGWMDGTMNLDVEYERMLGKYGRERTESMMGMLYGNYRELMLIDTGAYDVESVRDRFEATASRMNLDPVYQRGDLGPIERMLQQRFDGGDFVFVEPHRTTRISDFIDL